MDNSFELESRVIIVDILKTIAIFLVLLGHSIQVFYGDAQFYDDKLFTLIYSIHMALFIMISGYLFHFSRARRDVSGLIKKVMQSLLSLMIWGTFCYLIQLKSGSGMLPLSSIITSYWFVLVYIQIIAVGGAILLFFENKKLFWRGIGWIIGGVLLTFSPLLPEMNLYLYPFFLAGYLFGKYKKKLSEFYFKHKAIIVCICLVLYGISLYLYDRYDCFISKGVFPHDGRTIIDQCLIDIVRLLSGVFGTLLLTIIVYEICDGFKGRLSLGKLAFVGKYTLEIYYLQKILLEIGMPNILRKYTGGGYSYMNFTNSIPVVDLIIAPSCSLVMLVICLSFIKVLEKVGIARMLFMR